MPVIQKVPLMNDAADLDLLKRETEEMFFRLRCSMLEVRSLVAERTLSQEPLSFTRWRDVNLCLVNGRA